MKPQAMVIGAHDLMRVKEAEEPKRPKEPKELVRQRKLLAQGRGTGDGAWYLPYLQIERSGFQSHGRSHLIYNPSTRRQHHLLSDLELLNFIWAWSLGLADCREQYPLQLHDFDPLFPHLAGKTRGTLRIAADHGIKHPAITKVEPRVLTTDLLLTFADRSQVAVHAKYARDLRQASPRARQLRRIEEAYWKERGVRFLVSSESPFTAALASRMMWSLDGMKWPDAPQLVDRFLHRLDGTSRRAAMYTRLRECAHTLNWPFELTVRAFKYALLTCRWKPRDPNQELDLCTPWPGSRRRNFVQARAWTAKVRKV